MRKRILTIFISALLMIGVPVVSYSFSAIEIVENDFQTIAVSINESTLHVTGANGQTLYIYNVAGVKS